MKKTFNLNEENSFYGYLMIYQVSRSIPSKISNACGTLDKVLDDNLLLFSIPSLLLFPNTNQYNDRSKDFKLSLFVLKRRLKAVELRCLRFTIFLWSETHLFMYLSFFLLLYLSSCSYFNDLEFYSNAHKWYFWSGRLCTAVILRAF